MRSTKDPRNYLGAVIAVACVCTGCDETGSPAAPTGTTEYAIVPVSKKLSAGRYALHIFRVDLDGTVQAVANYSYPVGDPGILACPGGSILAYTLARGTAHMERVRSLVRTGSILDAKIEETLRRVAARVEDSAVGDIRRGRIRVAGDGSLWGVTKVQRREGPGVWTPGSVKFLHAGGDEQRFINRIWSTGGCGRPRSGLPTAGSSTTRRGFPIGSRAHPTGGMPQCAAELRH